MIRSSSLKNTTKFLRKHRKSPHSLLKAKWHQNFIEQQAIENLKQALRSTTTNPNHQPHLLSSLIHSFGLYNCDPTPNAYHLLLKSLAKASHLHHHLATVLDRLENVEKFEPPEIIFTDLIKIYGNAGKLDEALAVFYGMHKFRCAPSVFSLDALLSVLCRNNQGLKMVSGVLLECRKLNIRFEESTFRILVTTLCRIGKVDYAIEMLNCMVNDGISIDAKLCSLLFSSVCKKRDLSSEKILGFLEELKNNGFCPGIRDYSNLMMFLVHRGKGMEALDVLDRMKSNRIKPDVVCYTICLNGVIVEEDYKRADQLFDEMLVLGLVPDLYTYNVYINGLCKQNNLKGALQMIDCMETDGCKPNYMTYNIILKALVKTGDISRAKELLKEMELKGVMLNSRTYAILIDALVSKDEILKACELLEDVFEKHLDFHGVDIDELICGLCRKGSVDRAVLFIKKMANNGVSPGLRVWQCLLRSCG